MIYTVKLDECLDLMRVLSREVNAKYNIGENEISSPYIERDYGIRIKFGNILSKNEKASLTTVTFPSEEQYTLLKLKYYENYE
jgi:hypothetical protein